MKTNHSLLRSICFLLCFSSATCFAQNAKPRPKAEPQSKSSINRNLDVAPAKTNAGTTPPQMDQKIFPYPIYQNKMENGLNVVTVPYQSPGIAAFYIVVRTGSRNEVEQGHTGFAHFFEHMMFRGTDAYPKEKYSATLKSTGASANANTSLDRTLYHMTGDAGKLDTMFKIEADRFQNLKYSVQGFKTEAGAVKGEYTKNSANPYTKLNELIQNTAFESHTYKHTTMGFFDDIVNMPNEYQYSLDFFNRYYRPEYCTIIVVGDVTPDRVNTLAKTYFGNWGHGTYISQVPADPEQKETKFVNLQKAGFPPYLSLNYKGPAYDINSIDFPTIDILCAAYFGENSVIYNKLVIEEQRVRSMSADAQITRDPFLISVEASLVNDSDFAYVKSEIEKVLEEIKTKPIDPVLLEQTKMNFKNSAIMSIDNPTSIAQNLSYFTWVTGNPETLNTYFSGYTKVTPKDIMRVAQKYFVPNHLTIGTIAPTETVKF